MSSLMYHVLSFGAVVAPNESGIFCRDEGSSKLPGGTCIHLVYVTCI